MVHDFVDDDILVGRAAAPSAGSQKHDDQSQRPEAVSSRVDHVPRVTRFFWKGNLRPAPAVPGGAIKSGCDCSIAPLWSFLLVSTSIYGGVSDQMRPLTTLSRVSWGPALLIIP